MNSTEEEQIEAFKKWWADNGRAIVIGIIVGVGAISGWRFWESHQYRESQSASLIYRSVIDEFNTGNFEQVDDALQSLKESYTSTPYAALASLIEAKIAVHQERLDEAAAALRWTMRHSLEEDVRIIAELRLARVLSAQGQYNDALDLLDSDFPMPYTAVAEELKGDVLVARNDSGPAREAYRRALAKVQVGEGARLLQMKLDDLSTMEKSSTP